MALPSNPYASPVLDPAESHSLRASSGRVDPVLFPLAALVCIAVSLAVAAVLAQLFAAGYYLAMIVPIAASIVVAAAVYFAIRLGKCRNRWLGMALGACCGSAMYLGYYQFDLARQTGNHMLWRLDALPGHVAFRLRNDATRSLKEAGAPNRKPAASTNLIMFLGEWALVLYLTSVMGLRAASRAFDEAPGRWGKISYATIAHGQSQRLELARRQNCLAEVLWQLTPLQHKLHTAHCMLTLEQFETVEGEPPCAFLSAYELQMPGQSLMINELLFGKRVAIRQAELPAADLAACKRLFVRA
ncbi:hypothetical protein [Anatilimnocola floriformis]|uniref:hypothetical protein n=1 Tax=Anatilimnocola floriformis TaxID=2948575 RepID=UPI0020C4F8A6|nr:hypothetical protein [Anatilimnocola floriformis]